MVIQAEFKQKYYNFTLDISLKSRSLRLGILGGSGAGKSMTLKMLAGIMTPQKGFLSMDDRVLLDTGRRINVSPRKRRIGYLFQNYALFPNMTVEENIGAGIPGRGQEKKKTVSELITRFHLTGLEGQIPSELSGGQQQRVALARILACQPEMILLDEPFSALDGHLKDRMQRELLMQLEDYPGPVYMVSHSRDEIYRFSDEIIILDEGKIISQGRKAEVFAKPASIKAAALTGCKNFSRATRISDHSFRADSWGVLVSTSRALPDRFTHIGYRAHDFIPVWGEDRDKTVPFRLERIDDLPFERNYYIRPAVRGDNEEDLISWFVQRDLCGLLEEKGLPDYLKLDEEKILYFDE